MGGSDRLSALGSHEWYHGTPKRRYHGVTTVSTSLAAPRHWARNRLSCSTAVDLIAGAAGFRSSTGFAEMAGVVEADHVPQHSTSD
jgi:hypothetical protein